MALVDYTTFNDIRAALGVSSDEIEDATLSLDVYSYNLDAELGDMEPSPVAKYLELKDTEIDGMTDVEARFFKAMRLFASYSVARQLLPSLPMFAPKEQTDGKASVTRFAGDPYKETMKRVEAQYEVNLTRLIAALAKVNSLTATPTVLRPYFSAVAPAFDPVTGA